MALGLEILLGFFGQQADGEVVEATFVAGTEDDVATRIRAWTPRWFGNDPDEAPAYEATVRGPAWALSFIFDMIAFARQQARIATASGGWLELAANDYLGPNFRRLAAERDDAYSLRIRREVLRHRNTRAAAIQAVADLVGATPTVYEPWRAADCGGWGTPSMAYGVAGLYGSGGAPREAFLTTPFPQGYGIPGRGGWGSGTGAYGVPANFTYVDDADVTGSGPTIPDILAAVERVRPVGMTIYVQFSGLDGLPPIGAVHLP